AEGLFIALVVVGQDGLRDIHIGLRLLGERVGGEQSGEREQTKYENSGWVSEATQHVHRPPRDTPHSVGVRGLWKKGAQGTKTVRVSTRFFPKMQALIFPSSCPHFSYIYAALSLDKSAARVLACASC